MNKYRPGRGGAAASGPRYSTERGGPNEGDWICVGVIGGKHAVPIMSRDKPVMRLYRTPEEAIAASVEHSSTRVGGGWAINIRTGATVAIQRFCGPV